ncbi:MAG TPA: hypothetical protein VNO70_22800 [Blastocatellia bacterium]|nr:hypothetical protein [Blastocatellia bacterium]
MKKFILSLFILGLALTAPLVAPPGGAMAAQEDGIRFMILDNACDGRTFRINRVDPAAITGARGDTSIISGKLFVGETIPRNNFDRSFDLDANVASSIGSWVCVNTVLAEPPLTHVVTYHFTLEEGTLVVQGLNSHRTQGSVPRVLAIVGGTGRFSGASGEVEEEVIGNNNTGAFNLRFVFKIKKRSLK